MENVVRTLWELPNVQAMGLLGSAGVLETPDGPWAIIAVPFSRTVSAEWAVEMLLECLNREVNDDQTL